MKKPNYDRGHAADITVAYKRKSKDNIDIYLSYNDYKESDYRKAVIPFNLKRPAAVWFATNCVQHRVDFLKSLQAHFPVESLGACHRTHLTRNILPACWNSTERLDFGPRRYEEKECALSHYLFTLVIENSVDEGYITEKLYQALMSGSVPLYLGAPDVYKYLPSPDAIIDLRTYTQNISALGDYLLALSKNGTLYNRHLRWRHERFGEGFMKSISHGMRTLVCQVCDLAAVRRAKIDCALGVVASLQPFNFNGSMPVFVAHYSKLPDRAAHMHSFLARHNLTAQFITQFDREELRPAVLECLLAASTESRRRYEKQLMMGEISLFLKHLAAFSAVQRNNYPSALILEDDVREDVKLTTTLTALLAEANRLLPPDFDVFFVGGCLSIKCSQSAQRISGNGISLCRADSSRCTHAYIISAQGAAKLIKSAPMRAPIDWQMNYESLVLSMWYSDPPIMSQDMSLSSSSIRG
jgi:GR25 family glycosyltransferase involved in LPS biosynthesis